MVDKKKNKEEKRDKFVRLAEARTNKILNMMELLGNCSNRKVYEYDQSDVNQIFNALEAQLKKTKQRFTAAEEEKGGKFTLKNR